MRLASGTRLGVYEVVGSLGPPAAPLFVLGFRRRNYGEVSPKP
jgi:hypothetical protein